MGPTSSTDISHVQEVLELFDARLRTMSSFSPRHPIHEQEEEEVRKGFSGLWKKLSVLPLSVTAKGLEWEADSVLPIDDEKEGFAGALSEVGIRFLAQVVCRSSARSEREKREPASQESIRSGTHGSLAVHQDLVYRRRQAVA